MNIDNLNPKNLTEYQPMWMLARWWFKKEKHEIRCKRCNKVAQEDRNQGLISTGCYYRCPRCKIEAYIDETTESYNPKQWKRWKKNFKHVKTKINH